MSKLVKGDLLELAEQDRFDVIVHGCNCFHKMGAGIAKQISEKYPEALDVDRQTFYGEHWKLGQISSCYTGQFHIVNAYTQFHYGRGKQANYDAIEECFWRIGDEFSGRSIAYPKIGAGLAGGDWNKISKIINEALSGEDHTLVVYNG